MEEPTRVTGISDRLQALFGLGARVAAAEREADVLEVMVRDGASLAGATAAVVGIVEGQLVKVAVAAGYPAGYLDRWAEFPLEAGFPMSDVIASGAAVFCGSRTERDGRWPRFRGTGNATSEAFVVLPLAGRGELLGAFTLSFDEEREFDAEERAFLEALATQCALALERARASEAEQRLRDELYQALASEQLARERTQRLQRFTARLAPALAVDAVAEIAVDKALVASHGSTAFLALAAEDGRRLDVVRIDGRVPDEMRAVSAVAHDDRSAVGEVFRTREPLWLRDRAEWEAFPASIGRPGFLRSAAILPVTVAGRFLGVLGIAFDHERSFPDDERAFLGAIAGQTAQALDRARLYEGQRHIAQVLQESLLPRELPIVPGLRLAASYEAAGAANRVGGDFYDVFEAGGDYVVVVGDVCGKGPEAAALTALCRYTMRARTCESDDSPAGLLRFVNEAIVRHGPGADRFATIVCARVSLTGGRASAALASAGHPPALVRRRDGTVEEFPPTGPAAGIFDDAAYSQHAVRLEPGELLFLYTDGLADAREPGGRRLGEEAVRELLGRLPDGANAGAAVAASRRLLRGHERTDDIAIVALSVDAP
jgi:serine phosphatase RsbU (regulator of sigma subunit)/putative methionine-R-sulfoxide reductase with GAF domain